jgi:hypothetical protein
MSGPHGIVIEFWTTDEQPSRLEAYITVAHRYTSAHPNVDLRIIPKEEAAISSELIAAAAAGELPCACAPRRRAFAWAGCRGLAR